MRPGRAVALRAPMAGQGRNRGLTVVTGLRCENRPSGEMGCSEV